MCTEFTALQNLLKNKETINNDNHSIMPVHLVDTTRDSKNTL